MDRDSVTHFHLRRRNIRAARVEGDVAMEHELARLTARIGEAQPVDNVVEAHLEDAQQIFARDARHALGVHEMLVELALEDAVDVARLLLLFELQTELALFTAATIAGRSARRSWPPFDGTLRRETAFAFEEKFHARPSAKPADGTGVAGHFSKKLLDAPLLGRAAAVMRHGCAIDDGDYLEPGRLQRTDGCFTSSARTADEDTDLAHAVLHGFARRGV